MSDDKKDDYEVGYGKPPKSSQFKKGQPSPNPKGRPRKEALLSAAIREALGDDVTVNAKDGSKYKMKAAKAIGKKVVGQAASGDVSSQRLLLSLEKADAGRGQGGDAKGMLEQEPDEASQHLTLYLADLMRVTAKSSLFERDADGKTVLSPIGAPLSRLCNDVMGGQIQTAEHYKQARRDALIQTMDAMDDFAFEHLRHWQKNIQKSDLE